MTEEQEKKVKELVDRLMNLSLEELRELSKQYNEKSNPFIVFQEMSDAIESEDETELEDDDCPYPESHRDRLIKEREGAWWNSSH